MIVFVADNLSKIKKLMKNYQVYLSMANTWCFDVIY